MSDLQCPVRLFLARSGEAEALAAALHGERIARVWTSPLARAVETAEIAAAALGVDVVVREGLGPPDGPDRSSVPDRYRAVLDEVADLHRGESVLAISHGELLSVVLPGLATNVRPQRALGHPLGPGDVVELAGDSDGWVAVRWDGHTLLG